MVRRLIVSFVAAAGLFATVLCSAKGSDKLETLTYEQACIRFQNAFGVTDSQWEKPFEVYPENRLYVDVKNKKLYFESKDDGLLSWEYTSTTGTLKKIKSGKMQFTDWLAKYMKLDAPTYEDLAEGIKISEKYAKAINDSELSEEDKIFSLLYNALVGDPVGYICAYVNAEGEFVKVQYSDYGKLLFNVAKFIEVMSAFKDAEEMEGQSAYDFLDRNKVISKAQSPKICYWNYREDKMLILPESKLHFKVDGTQRVDQSLVPHVDLIMDNPGTVFYTEGEVLTLKDLKDFTTIPVRCLAISKDKLLSYRYKYVEPEPSGNKVLLIIAIGAVIMLLIVAGYVCWLLMTRRKKAVKPTKPVVGLADMLRQIAQQQNPSPKEILQAFDHEFKTNVCARYVKNITYAKSFDQLKTQIGSGKESMETLVAAVDTCLFGDKKVYTAAFEKRMEQANEDAKKYNDFINLTSEVDVMANLDVIRKKKPSFPEVATVRRTVDVAVRSSKDKTEQIFKFLQLANMGMYAQFDAHVKDAASYKTIAAVLRNLKPGERADQYLAGMIDGLAIDASPKADHYLEFVENFKSADPGRDGQLLKAAAAARARYAKVDNAADALIAGFDNIANDEVDQWERLAFIYAMADCAKELYLAYGQDHTSDVDKNLDVLKSDMIKLFISKLFMLVANNPETTDENLKKAFSLRVPKMIAAFNEMMGREEMKLDDEELQQYMEQCLIAVRKIRLAEKSEPFFTAMWDKYVKDYAENLLVNMDKGWLLGNSVQIAFYFADFLKHVVDGIDKYYCNNYNYLEKKELEECESDYVEHHIRLSDDFSNFVYSFLKEHGAKDVDVMVGNFRIRM